MTSHQRKSPGIKKALVTTGTAASLLGASFVAMPATFANVPDQVPTSPACDCQPGQPGQRLHTVDRRGAQGTQYCAAPVVGTVAHASSASVTTR